MIDPFKRHELSLALNIIELRLLIRLLKESNPSKSEEEAIVYIHDYLESALVEIMREQK